MPPKKSNKKATNLKEHEPDMISDENDVVIVDVPEEKAEPEIEILDEEAAPISKNPILKKLKTPKKNSSKEPEVKKTEEMSHNTRVLTREEASKSVVQVDSSTFRFKVLDMTPNKWQPTLGDRSEFDPTLNIKHLPIYEENNYQEILQNSQFKPNTTFDLFGNPHLKNALVKTVFHCWKSQHNFVVRPDDFWATLVTQLSFFFCDKAEIFRSQFVKFNGKMALKIPVGELRTFSIFSMVKLMVGEISKNLIDKEFKAWFIPNFSTTNETDTIAYGIALMAAMKKYFSYNIELVLGGASLPVPVNFKQPKAQGNDWCVFQDRLAKLKSFKLESFHKNLSTIASNYVKTRNGQIDIDFWTNCCHYVRPAASANTHEELNAIIGGWITAFCAFSVDGKLISSIEAEDLNPSEYEQTTTLKKIIEKNHAVIRIGSVPSSLTHVDLGVIDVEDNFVHETALFGGSMGFEVMNEGRGLKPISGWAFALKEEKSLYMCRPVIMPKTCESQTSGGGGSQASSSQKSPGPSAAAASTSGSKAKSATPNPRPTRQTRNKSQKL